MGINVLSVFDGISAGQLALQRANIQVDNYFASEIDKYAIKITQKNFPNTCQLGDVTKWQDWNLPKIDLLIGGSPCQGFSNAGLGLNFEDPRSKLFFEYVNILKYYQPDYFWLENVKMKKEWQRIISEFIGVEPIEINSALVSAQSRKRLYWTNIPNITQPEDKGILLKDIINNNFDGEEELLRKKSKSLRIGGRNSPKDSKQEWDNLYDKNNIIAKNKSQTVLSTIYKENEKSMVKRKKFGLMIGCVQVGEGDIKGFDIIKRVYSPDGKSPSLTTMQGGQREPKISEDNITWRKLTPLECERLQTFPDNYTEGISNTQRYKSLGNSWTVDVISHVCSFLPDSYKLPIDIKYMS